MNYTRKISDMDIIEYREFCLSLPLTEESTPFDEDTLVYKVCGKMYTLGSISDFKTVTVKCIPERLMEYNENYETIRPAFHMNKRHWMELDTERDLPDEFIRDRIRDSYALVIKGLTKALRSEAEQAAADCGYVIYRD